MLTSCGNVTSNDNQMRLSKDERLRLLRADSLALKIAVMPTLDCLPIFVAKDCSMYDTAQVDLRLRLFSAQMDCDTAVSGKSVEGFVSDVVRIGRLNGNGIGLECLSETDAFWQLIANRKARVKRVSQLGDKMVGMTRFSATDELTDDVLKGVKLSSMVFRIQVNDVNVRLAMLINNELDAAWLEEPQATMARRYGNNVLCDSREMKRKFGAIAFRKDIMGDVYRKKQIKAFAEAYNMACDSINKNGLQHYKNIISKYCKVDGECVALLPKIRYRHIGKSNNADMKVERK